MAYDPADLKLPNWLLWSFNLLVRISLPIFPKWRLQLTRPGILFIAALLAVIAAALYSGNNLLYLCAAMLFVLAASAAGHALWLLKNIPILAEYMPEYIIAHQNSALRTMILWGFPVSGSVQIKWHISLENQQQIAKMDMPVCSIRAEEDDKSLFIARLPAYYRGLYDFHQQWLSTDAPLGLWHFSCIRNDKWTLAVLPKPITWQQNGRVLDKTSNNMRTSIPEGDEWHDLRAYIPGDSLARIHWRKGISCEQWMVKRFGQSKNEAKTNILCVDLRLQLNDKLNSTQAFERLLGMAYAWMNEHPQGKIILGQQKFYLSDSKQNQQARLALAAAVPEYKAPALEADALLLSLIK
ncbi:MAG: DUF58 domain-containing protein [Mariprofundales bacterium]